jgi:curved DNA-binding protein
MFGGGFGDVFGGGGLGGFSDFFEMLFGDFGARSGGFGGRQRSVRSARGRDNEQSVQISLEDAFHGTTCDLQWEGGRRIQAKIPPGVRTGSRVRLSGQGESSFQGRPAGDLYLKISVKPHPTFKRDGDDLRVTLLVDLYIALLGGKVNVPTLERPVELTIPPETSNGKVFRLRGLGMPKLSTPKQRGNLYATIQVQLPKNLSQEEVHLFKKLQDLHGK